MDVNGCSIETAAKAVYKALVEYYVDAETLPLAAKSQTLAAYEVAGYAALCSFSSAWHAVGVDDVFWHGGGNAWKVAYLGWAYFHNNGSQFVLTDSIWYSYTDHELSDGSMSVYSFDTGGWYWVSAETFPSYYDFTTSTWDTFSGSFN